jgi:hypothetical protein
MEIGFIEETHLQHPTDCLSYVAYHIVEKCIIPLLSECDRFCLAHVAERYKDCSSLDIRLSSHHFYTFIENGSLSQLKWLHERRCPFDLGMLFDKYDIITIRRADKLKILRWLIDCGYVEKHRYNPSRSKLCINERKMLVSVELARLRWDYEWILYWLNEGIVDEKSVFHLAIRGEDIRLIQILHRWRPFSLKNHFWVAIRECNVSFVRRIRYTTGYGGTFLVARPETYHFGTCGFVMCDFCISSTDRIYYDYLNLIVGNAPLEHIRYFIRKRIQFHLIDLHVAVRRGNLGIIKLLYENGCVMHHHCYGVAFRQKRFDIVEWLCEHQCPIDGIDIDHVIWSGSVSWLKWFQDRGYRLPTTARYNGVNLENTEMLEYLTNQGVYLEEGYGGDEIIVSVDAIDWLYVHNVIPESETPPPNIVLGIAKYITNMNEVKYLLSKYNIPISGICTTSIQYQRLDILSYLEEMKYDLHRRMDFCDVENTWSLRETEFPKTLLGNPHLQKKLYNNALEKDDWNEIYLLNNIGCKITSRCLQRAVYRRSVRVVIWLLEIGCPCRVLSCIENFAKSLVECDDRLARHNGEYIYQLLEPYAKKIDRIRCSVCIFVVQIIFGIYRKKKKRIDYLQWLPITNPFFFSNSMNRPQFSICDLNRIYSSK